MLRTKSLLFCLLKQVWQPFYPSGSARALKTCLSYSRKLGCWKKKNTLNKSRKDWFTSSSRQTFIFICTAASTHLWEAATTKGKSRFFAAFLSIFTKKKKKDNQLSIHALVSSPNSSTWCPFNPTWTRLQAAAHGFSWSSSQRLAWWGGGQRVCSPRRGIKLPLSHGSSAVRETGRLWIIG